MVPSGQQGGWRKRLPRVMRGRLGCLAVLAAMLGQLLLGGVMTAEPVRAERVALVAADLLCSSGNVPVGGHRRQHHHAVDPALCPALLALHLPASILTPAMAPPMRTVMPVAGRFERPLLRGPPPAATRPGTPRGPPPSL